MISLILGALTLGLGLRGFTPAGLPLTKNRRITGGKARVIGGICIFLAIVFLLDGLLWVAHMAGFIKQSVQ